MNATVPQPETSKKFFTSEEANRTLPLVRVIVSDIVTLYNEVRERRDRLAAITGNDSSTGHRDEVYSEEVEQMEASIYEDIERLKEYIAELTQLGIDLKDPQTGLVDFPGLVDGREVCLCWQQGEEQVSFWHEVDAGFAGRQPITTDQQSQEV